MVANDREEDYTVPNKIRVIYDFEKVYLLFISVIDSIVVIIISTIIACSITTTIIILMIVIE